MKKSSRTKFIKGERKAQKKLEGTTVLIQCTRYPARNLSGAAALAWGRELLMVKKVGQALQVAEQLYSKFEDVIVVNVFYGNVLIVIEELVKVTPLVNSLIKSAPGNVEVNLLAARYQLLLGNIRQALSHLSMALKERKNDVEALYLLVDSYQALGDKQKLIKTFEKMLAIANKHKALGGQHKTNYISVLSGMVRHLDYPDEMMSELQQYIDDPSAELGLQSAVAFRLAEGFKVIKDREREIKFLKIANELQAESFALNRSNPSVQSQLDDEYQKMVAYFSAESSQRICYPEGNNTVNPVFIIGLPRSGTTLVEQILGSHSQFGQVGESKALQRGLSHAYRKCTLLNTIDHFPDELERLTEQALGEVADYYAAHQKLMTEKERFVEKELSGIKYVGLAAKLFPGAKFVHMNRPSLDNILSCYRGSIPGIPYTHSIEQTAFYYIHMKKMVGLWQKLFPQRVYVLDYVDLVNNTEEAARQLLDFLDLDWEDEILDFHTRRNIVRTLSVGQVKQKIYNTSIEIWQEYEDLLKPAINILDQAGIKPEGVQYIN